MIKGEQTPLLETWFMRYLRWDIPRVFHNVYLTGEIGEFLDDGNTPLIVCLNHSSWWDAVFGLFIEEEFFNWERYSVMEEKQLLRYRFFSKIGMIGVDRTGLKGAREFLEYVQPLLNGKRRSLWLTPQGEFSSNYLRPIKFQSGVSHIAASLGRFYFTTIAFHYEFWNERKPEAFVSFSPVELFETSSNFNRKEWLQAQERRLEAQLDSLLALAERRDPALFKVFLSGKTGTNAIYDTVRALSASVKGETFSAEHGRLKNRK